MTGIVFKFTDAGRAALVNAAHDGTQARRIVSVGVTASAFTPTAELAAIPAEIKRISTIAGDVVAADTIHITVRDDGPDTYTVRGLGLYLDNGVLLGTYSQSAVILEKSAASIFLLATDVRVLDGSVDISMLQFGETSFINPPATTERQGVVQLATQAIANALTDATRALTAASVSALFAARAMVTRKINAGTGLSGGGDLSADRTLSVAFGTTASTVAAGNHTHSAATTGAAGMMSAADKAKLDGIEAQANKYTHPTGDGNQHVPRTFGDANGMVLGVVGDALAWVNQLSLGNSAAQAAAGNHTHTWASITSKPTTLSGYGITDAVDMAGNQTISGTKTFSSAIGGSITGNASTATKLATARTIGGVPFDGSANISLPGVNAVGNQNTTGNAATATKLATARSLQTNLASTAAASFDGSGNASPGITGVLGIGNGGTGASTVAGSGTAGKVLISGASTTAAAPTWRVLSAADIPTLNQSTTGNAATATKLATARTLTLGSTGKTFDGTGNVAYTLEEMGAAASSHTHAAATASAAGLVELATSAETRAGTDAVRAVTPAGLAATCLGMGQAWQDVAASRAIDTVYTNSTGRPIVVSVSVRNTGDSPSTASLFVAGISVARNITRYSSHEKIAFVSAIVPAGATYEVSETTGTIYIWAELR